MKMTNKNRKYFQQLVKKEYQIDESKNKDLKFLIKNDPLDIYYFYVYVRTVQDAASSLKNLDSIFSAYERVRSSRIEKILKRLFYLNLVVIDWKRARVSDFNSDVDHLIDFMTCYFKTNIFLDNQKSKTKDAITMIERTGLALDEKQFKREETVYYINLLAQQCHLTYSTESLLDIEDIQIKIKKLFSKYNYRTAVAILRLSAIDAQGYCAKLKRARAKARPRYFRHNLKFYSKQVDIGRLNFKNFILPKEITNDLFYLSFNRLCR